MRFDENIPNRLAAQRASKVTPNPPVEGAFYWLNNREGRWRPPQYWKPGTTVDVAVNTYGVYLLGDRFSHIIMDSSIYGVPVNSPNGYRTDVDWAT